MTTRELTYVKAFNEGMFQVMAEDPDVFLIGEDVGIDGAAASAEEAAMHVIERLPEDSDSE